MRAGIRVVLLTGVAAAPAIGLSATSSLAATGTWSVSPGGAITRSGGMTRLTDTTASVTITCTTSSATGKFKTGSGLSGVAIGTVTSMAFTNCTMLGQVVLISTGPVAYKLNALSYTVTSGVTHGSISKMHFAVSSSTCSFGVDGTAATANNGKVKTTYTNSTHKLKVLPRGNLHIYVVAGCFGLLNTGDAATLSSTYTVSPVQTITSP